MGICRGVGEAHTPTYACVLPCGVLLQQPTSVPFRKFDEEVLRTLRVPSASPPSPSPPGLDDQAADTAVSGGEGEDLKEAGAEGPPPPSKPHPSPGACYRSQEGV